MTYFGSPAKPFARRQIIESGEAIVSEPMEINCPNCQSDKIVASVGGFSIVGMFIGAALGLVLGPYIAASIPGMTVIVAAVPIIALLSALLLGLTLALLGQNYVRIGCLACGHIWSPRQRWFGFGRRKPQS
jgi:hypothetical protein